MTAHNASQLRNVRATIALSFLNQSRRTYGVIARQDTEEKGLKRGCHTPMSLNRTTITLQSVTETGSVRPNGSAVSRAKESAEPMVVRLGVILRS